MKNLKSRAAVLLFIFVFLGMTVAAQTNDSKKKRTLKITGKVPAFTLKTTVKFAVETGKFVGKNVVVPFAKNVAWPVAKATPPLAAKGIKLTAKGLSKGIKAVTNDDDGETKISRSASAN